MKVVTIIYVFLNTTDMFQCVASPVLKTDFETLVHSAE